MYRILGGIYVLGIEPLNAGADLKKDGISHVLSVVPGPIPSPYESLYSHLQIPVTDETTTNVIEHFAKSNAFIDLALCGPRKTSQSDPRAKHVGAILVHCAQGVSRSVTFVVAYLMYRYGLKVPQALHAVTRKKDDAEPNDGFLRQLRLYEAMGCDIDENNEEYRKFLVETSLQKDPSGAGLRDIKRFKPTDLPKGLEDGELRCKRCRQHLAYHHEIETHLPPDAESRQSRFVKTAPNSRRIISASEAAKTCSHYFVSEPLEWMRPELEGKGEMDGKFACPKCESKVGGYSWKGSRCSCGKWMIPAIHLQSAKVDHIKRVGGRAEVGEKETGEKETGEKETLGAGE